MILKGSILDCRQGVIFTLPLTVDAMFPHTMILGESGSGKTESVVGEKTREVLASKSEKGYEASVLIIDAKNEYDQIVDDVLGENSRRKIKIDGNGNLFNCFELNIDMSLAEKVMPIYDNVPGTSIADANQNAIFAAKGRATFLAFLTLDQAYYDRTQKSIFADACDILNAWEDLDAKVGEIEEVIAGRNGHASPYVQKRSTEFEGVDKGDKRHESISTVIETVFHNKKYDDNYFLNFKRFIGETFNISSGERGWSKAINLIIYLAELCQIDLSLVTFLSPYKRLDRNIVDQWYYITSYFEPFFDLIFDKTVERYLDINPFNISNLKLAWGGQEVKRLVPHWDKGGVVVLKLNTEKNSDRGFDFVGKVLKKMLFQYTFIRNELQANRMFEILWVFAGQYVLKLQ